MVLVGGATRLTESGLSIVEWKPVTGTLPPLNEAQWAQAFEGYKAIPQYRELNAGMSLAEFKTIFWWEWSHRLLGRVIGAVYLLPFLYFLWRGALGAELKRRLWLIFGLGALQGAVGWWMVASGLTQRTEVSQYRLATHLMLALIIFASIVWTLRRMSARPQPVVAVAAEGLRRGPARADLRPALFRRAGRGPARGQGVQHLARDRRRLHSVGGAAVVRGAVVAQSVRQHAHRAVRASHDRLCAADPGAASRDRRHAVAGRRGRHRRRVVRWWRRSFCRRRSASSRCCIRCRSIWRWRIRLCAIVVLTLAVLQTERLVARRVEHERQKLVLPLGQPG